MTPLLASTTTIDPIGSAVTPPDDDGMLAPEPDAPRAERARESATALVLVLLGVFLYSRVVNGSLLFYINARFSGLTLAAALGLMAIGVTYGGRHLRALADRTDPDEGAHEHGHDDGHGHGHGHGHGENVHDHDHRDDDDPHGHGHGHDHHGEHDHGDHDHSHGSWLALAIIALPALLGIAFKPRPLGASSMSGRDLSVNAAAISPGRAAIERRLAMPVGDRTILDWLLAFENTPDPVAHTGEHAHVTGFVYRDAGTPDDIFLVSRFFIRCCAADGMAVFLPVRWPDAAKLDADGWVDVEGTFAVGRLRDKDQPILEADTVTSVEPPAQPYLYP